MARCNDCIHFSLCDYNTNNSVTEQRIKLFFDEGAEKCSFFKDKQKFVELPYAPIPCIHDGTGFNTDAYCPNCGTNLSGYYTDGIEEPLCTIQCYNCGIICDNTKSVTKEEAEQALREDETK